MLCLLCVTPLVCSSNSSFALSSPLFSSWWPKHCELFTHPLVLQCSPSTSSCQPQTTHVFADIGLHYCVMRFAYALHMRLQNLFLFPCLYTEPFELVIQIIFHYYTTPPCHKINLFERPFQGSRFECLDDAFVLLVSLIFFRRVNMTKDTYIYGKRDAMIWQKRRISVTKETQRNIVTLERDACRFSSDEGDLCTRQKRRIYTKKETRRNTWRRCL